MGSGSIGIPYLTLPYGEDILPPSAEASNGPNAHPRINRKVTKSPSAILPWVHTNTWQCWVKYFLKIF